MKKAIINSIKNQNLIEFYYKNKIRIVEPHSLGINLKDNLVLSAYQIDGESESIGIPNWGLFTVSKIEKLRMLDDKFNSPRIKEGFNRNSIKLKDIICEL